MYKEFCLFWVFCWVKLLDCLYVFFVESVYDLCLFEVLDIYFDVVIRVMW
jgi:hypothetical protein